MKKRSAVVALVVALAALATTPAAATTITRSVVVRGTTITCVVTYTDSNGNNRIDTFGELRSITSVSCSISGP